MLSLVGLAALIAVAALVSPHLLLKLHTQGTALDRLVVENEQLREDRVYFEEQLTQVYSKVDSVEAQTGLLASALGVEELPSFKEAAGGALQYPAGRPLHRRAAFDEQVDVLSRRAEVLSRSLEQLDVAFQARISLLASTPNMLPVDGWFSHGFGWRTDPFNGKRQFHRGMDIVAESGTPVVAPADGVVDRALRVSDYGNTIDLVHGHGFKTRYGHLSKILVSAGQQVERGDVIGYVGSTGRSTGPHLHYEVFRDGRRVNPWKHIGS